MNIIGITHQTSGCGYHRVLLPLAFMDGIKGYVTNWITEDKTQAVMPTAELTGSNWDIMLYNRLSPYDADWNKLRELLGCKVVIDMDDSWHLPPNHINYFEYEAMAKRIENNIINADMVTVTNKLLYDKVYPLNNNVYIFPNSIPFGLNQFTEDRREDDRCRIFWAGGISHMTDIELLRGPVKKLKQHASKIKMVIGGYNDTDVYSKSVWDKMFSAFTAGGSLPYMKLHATRPVDYMQMYENADIMVIPLEDTEWHACKSNLKILEAASKRIPCVVSNVAPYNLDSDCPVFWVNSQKDWFSHLNYLILNPAARQEAGNKLYEWAKKHYNLADINQRRKSAFADLCEIPTPA